MSKWSIVPHETKDGEVDVKFCHYIPNERNGKTEFIRLNPSKGWIAVKLGYECFDGSIDECRVNYSPRHGTYTFHHPDSNANVLVNGRVTNPLNPETKAEKNSKKLGPCPVRARKYIEQVTKNPELAQRVIDLIDGCLAEQELAKAA